MPDQNGPKNAQQIILSPKCLLPPCRGQRDLRLGPQRSRPARGAKRPGGRLAQAPQNGRADCELGAAAHAAHCRAHLWAEPGPKFNTLLQGGHSGRGLDSIDGGDISGGTPASSTTVTAVQCLRARGRGGPELLLVIFEGPNRGENNEKY